MDENEKEYFKLYKLPNILECAYNNDEDEKNKNDKNGYKDKKDGKLKKYKKKVKNKKSSKSLDCKKIQNENGSTGSIWSQDRPSFGSGIT